MTKIVQLSARRLSSIIAESLMDNVRTYDRYDVGITA